MRDNHLIINIHKYELQTVCCVAREMLRQYLVNSTTNVA